MAIVVQCSRCQQRFAAADYLGGKQVACSNCGATLSVPRAANRNQGLSDAAASATTPVARALPTGSILVTCAHCGQRFTAVPRLAGQRVVCGSCGQPLTVPRSPSSAASQRALPKPYAPTVDLRDLGGYNPLAASSIDTTPRDPSLSRRLPVPARQSTSLQVDDIPQWLWWAGGGALGLCVLVFALMIVTSMLSGHGDSVKLPGVDVDTKVAHSFNVITDVEGDGYRLNGYTHIEAGIPQAFSPGAILIVGLQEGVTLDDKQFDYGSIVLVEGDERGKTVRLGNPIDNVAVKHDVEVFGQTFPKGRFLIPEGGKLDARSTIPPADVQKPLRQVAVIQEHGRDPYLRVRFPWKKCADPCISMMLIWDDSVDIDSLQFAVLSGPDRGMALSLAKAFADKLEGQTVSHLGSADLVARKTRSGKIAVCAAGRTSLEQDGRRREIGAWTAFYLLDDWAVDERELHLEPPMTIMNEDVFAERGRVRVWVLSNEKEEWHTDLRWPGCADGKSRP